ncbi:MAG: ABC transporter ATP-binding protein [Gallicola sp.]|nr:ABC transporter ATP-binding protein [Gallicola sp.]
MTLLKVQGLKKVFFTRFGSQKIEALKDINFEIEQGEYVAIMGESGSGKTTLLNQLALLDEPTEGQVFLKGVDLFEKKDKDIASFRRNHLGYVFQDFNLLDTFTLEDNILLPLVLKGEDYAKMREKLIPIIEKLQINTLMKKYPYEVSGGEKQRAAVARAMITEPELILADEPTGALDSASSDELLGYFNKINDNGQTIIMVTHSTKAASTAKRILFIKDGKIFHQLYKGNRNSKEMYEEISNSLTMMAKGGK